MKHSEFYDNFFKEKVYRNPTINKNILFNEAIKRFVEYKQSNLKQAYKVLDVGCGPGHLVKKFLSFNDVDITAFDITEKVLETLSKIYKTVSFKHMDFSCPQMLPEKFDVITAIEVLEHIPYEKQFVFVKNCVDALNPGGILILTTPNKDRMHIMPEQYRATQLVEDWLTISEVKKLLDEGFSFSEVGSGILYFPNIYIDAFLKRLFYPVHISIEQSMLRHTSAGAHIIATAIK